MNGSVKDISTENWATPQNRGAVSDIQANEEIMPAAMTIAGSDSGGGAGIQADLRTFSALRVFGTCAIAAVTAQNPYAVTGIAAIQPEMVALQIRTVLEKIDVKAVKTGMLFSSALMEAVADALSGFHLPLITDPVMVSTSGKMLMEKDAAETLIRRILPAAVWITPNLPETEVLTGKKIASLKDMINAARLCSAKWHCGTIVKGGHAVNDAAASDVVCFEDSVFLLSAERCPVSGQADHGTGCTFSAALAAFTAKGFAWRDAVIHAKAFVLASLSESVKISGKGTRGMFPPAQGYLTYIQKISCKEV